MKEIEAKPEKKISNYAKTFAQGVWNGVSNEEIYKRIYDDQKLLNEKDLIWNKINGIRKTKVEEGVMFVIPKDEKTSIKPEVILSVEDMDEMIARQSALAEKMEPTKKPERKNGGEVLWDGNVRKLEDKEVAMPVEKNKRGFVVSLLRATDSPPLKKPQVKTVEKNGKIVKIRTSVHAVLHDPIGVEISIDQNTRISEANGVLMLQIGDLRITGVPPEEIVGNKLRGLFDADVVKIERSDESRYALYPKLSFLKHLNGTKLVYGLHLDKVKEEELAPCSIHMTPSANRDFVHFKILAQ